MELVLFLPRIDTYAGFILPLGLKTDNAVHQRIQCVVLSYAHVGTRMDFRAQLPDEYVARFCELSVGPLGTTPFSDRVSPVSGAALSLFMSHVDSPFYFFAAGFPAVFFVAVVLLAVVFVAVVFVAVVLLAVVFFATGFLAAGLLAAGFLAAGFSAAGVF